jgi:hypothetical protein
MDWQTIPFNRRARRLSEVDGASGAVEDLALDSGAVAEAGFVCPFVAGLLSGLLQTPQEDDSDRDAR